MERFKSSAWPLAIILVVMFALSSGIAFSCSSKKKEKKAKTDSTNVPQKASLDQSRLDQASFPELAANFVQRAVNGKSVQKHLQIFKNINPDTLKAALNTPRKRLTFWLDVYNGYTQYFLKKDPSLYKKNRSKYFDKNQIHLAGYDVSFNDIEHGILRKGGKIWSKGYIRTTIFSRKFVKKYKMNTVDYRIHFALNCGAKSCPPIVVYRQDVVARQLNDNARYYLNETVKYNKEKNVVKLPAFLKWFSADFGGQSGKRKILRNYGIIPQDAKPKIKYLDYDWTPKIENYKSYSYSKS